MSHKRTTRDPQLRATHGQFVIKGYVRYLFSVLFVIFVLNKLYLRPWILETGDSGVLLTLVNSLPNFIEAIMGTLILTGLALHLKFRFNKSFEGLSHSALYLYAQKLSWRRL